MDVLNTLLEISVYAAVIYLAVMLIKKLLGNKMSPALHYAIWALLIVRLIMPVTIDSSVRLFVIPDGLPQAQPTVQYAPSSDDIPAWSSGNTSAAADTSSATTDAAQTMTEQTAAGSADKTAPAAWAWPTGGILIAVWLAGLAAALAYISVIYAVFRRRIRQNAAPPSAHLERLFAQCKQEMGIKRPVRLLSVYGLETPALFVPPAVLVPPEIEATMDNKQIMLVLRHELTHFKRADHIQSMLMLALQAIYWFNPFVWLAVRQMRTDMEVACDSAVASPLDGNGKSEYAGLIISMFSAGLSGHVVLGMAQGDSKKVAEKRLRGIFANGRSRRSALLAAALLAVVLLVSCFTTACQPTPEKPVVIGRQEDVLAAVEPVHPDDFEPIEAPGHISEVHELSYAKIIYAADVAIPETTAYPVTEVEKRVLTEEDVLSYIDLFAGSDYEMYFGWTLTKDDYLALLTKVEPYKGTERVTKQIIERLQELYDKATNGDANRRISSLSDIPIEYAEHFPSVSIKTADGAISNFSWERDGNYFGYKRDDMTEACSASSVTNDQYTENMDGPVEHFRWKQPAEPDISQEDAYAVALKYRDAMDIDLELYSAELCSFITGYVDKTTGWQFTFTRTISGLRTMDTFGTLGWRKETAPSYGSPWGEETLVIAVDKSGLFSLGWNGASGVSRTVAESVQLLDFDTIHQRITEQLGYNYAYPAEENGNYEIEVTQISLGISMISMENRMDIGEYLPTWYVTYRYKPENQGKDDWRTQQIMFSAIDGSYIEPRISVKDLMGDLDSIGSSSASGMNEV